MEVFRLDAVSLSFTFAPVLAETFFDAGCPCFPPLLVGVEMDWGVTRSPLVGVASVRVLNGLK